MSNNVIQFSPQPKSLRQRFQQAARMINDFDFKTYEEYEGDYIAQEAMLIELSDRMVEVIDRRHCKTIFEENTQDVLRQYFNRLYVDLGIQPTQKQKKMFQKTLENVLEQTLQQTAHSLGLKLD